MKEKEPEKKPEEKKIKTIEEATTVLRLNSSKEKLAKLAQDVDKNELELLLRAALSLSWKTESSAFSSFVIANKKRNS
jgi:hypothetical protein